MVKSRWIKMSLFFMLVFQFTGALSGELWLFFTVRDGDEATLPCENVIKNQHSCDATTWFFSDSQSTQTVELADLGKIREKAKSNRLSVTADCSLIIKKVTVEDVGRYTCRQFRRESETQEGQDAVVLLSVVIMTEQKNTDQVTLSCSVRTYERCKHRVKWIHNSEDLNTPYSNLQTSQSRCSATVTFLNLAYTHISSYDFKCIVTTEDNKVQLFSFSPRSSGEETNTATTIKIDTITKNTTKELEIINVSTKLPGEETNRATIKLEIMMEKSIKVDLTAKELEITDGSRKLPGWCWYRLSVVSVGLAALITAAVVVNIWIRAVDLFREEKAATDENTVCR
ncbi:uncharacterized protein LOC115774612 isoform X2 [Archocentrus centrarchus]|uniref:uncharacterized protein LOC115774612 isoform X2 n=2 Tax=Archocentrus centrarchus TaxID=63155 RepID=UPI0011E9D96B|nr:uncharacterized protein LOC115774612 isoform X2 [Archocentrus centrarchus]